MQKPVARIHQMMSCFLILYETTAQDINHLPSVYALHEIHYRNLNTHKGKCFDSFQTNEKSLDQDTKNLYHSAVQLLACIRNLLSVQKTNFRLPPPLHVDTLFTLAMETSDGSMLETTWITSKKNVEMHRHFCMIRPMSKMKKPPSKETCNNSKYGDGYNTLASS